MLAGVADRDFADDTLTLKHRKIAVDRAKTNVGKSFTSLLIYPRGGGMWFGGAKRR